MKILLLFFIIINNILSMSLTPTFDRQSENVTVTIGNTAILSCFINNLGDHKVVWIKVGNTEIIAIGDYKITSDERYDIPHNYVNDWTLTIEQTNEEDIGEYLCQVNTEPQIVKKLFLEVLLPPKIIEERTTINPSPVAEGDTLTLNCFVDGNPIPKVAWYFRKKIANNHVNENELKFNYENSYSSNEEKSPNMIPIEEGNVLTIENIGRNYTGYFECIANNSVQPAASRKMKVSVEFSPEIYIQTSKYEEKIGADVRFECKIVANPLINHYWIKDGRVIENSVDINIPEFKNEDHVNTRESLNKYEININNNNNDFITINSLLVRNLTHSDFGNYECFALNKYNNVRETVELKEIIIPTTTTIIKTTTFETKLISPETHKNSMEINNIIEIHSHRHEHEHHLVSTVSNRALSKHHKKSNHTFIATERSENDAHNDFDRTALMSNTNRNFNSKFILLFNTIIYFSYYFLFSSFY